MSVAGVFLYRPQNSGLSFPLTDEHPALALLSWHCIIRSAVGMTAESIIERIYRKPFQPITLQTFGGMCVDVDRETDIFIYDCTKASCVVVFDPEGKKLIFGPQQISTIEVR